MENPSSNKVVVVSNEDIGLDESFSLSDAVSTQTNQEQTLPNISDCSENLDNVLNTKKILNVHWECHNGDGDQSCTKQNTCQNSKQKTEAQKPKIWKCKYNCGKIFTQEKYMNNHILVMHENVNMVQCEICSKYLSTKSRLKSHMLRHSGVKHLICLVCINKRFSELSCLRHHLLEEHKINGKHPLFIEAYYQLSLKEISIVEKAKKNDSGTLGIAKKRKETINLNQKSALDIEELKDKIKEKSNKFHANLKVLVPKIEKTNQNSNVNKAKNDYQTEDPNLKRDVSNFLQILNSKPQKIVTAENGMKLVKLANGQFKKISSI